MPEWEVIKGISMKARKNSTSFILIATHVLLIQCKNSTAHEEYQRKPETIQHINTDRIY